MIDVGISPAMVAMRQGGAAQPSDPERTLLVESFALTGASAAVSASAGDLLVFYLIAVNDLSPDVGMVPNASWGSQMFEQAVFHQFAELNQTLGILTLLVSEANAGSHAVVPDWSDGDQANSGVGSIERWAPGISSAVPDRVATTDGVGSSPDSGYTAETTQARELALCVVAWSGVPAHRGAAESGYAEGVAIGVFDALNTHYRLLTDAAAVRAQRSRVSEEMWSAACVTVRVSG